MRTFKDLYYLVSYSLLAMQVGFISILIYNKIMHGKIPYYGSTINPIEISENNFNVLKILLYATFALMVIWALFTPLAIIANRRANKKDHIDIVIGVWGFISAVILLIIDPFGIFKWFTG